MFARTPQCAESHFCPEGTTNVQRVPVPLGFTNVPLGECGPSVAVWIPSEKLEPSVPGSLTAVPDCPSARELSHTEIVNELRVSISGAAETADCPAAVIASAPPRGPVVQPAPPSSVSV